MRDPEVVGRLIQDLESRVIRDEFPLQVSDMITTLIALYQADQRLIVECKAAVSRFHGAFARIRTATEIINETIIEPGLDPNYDTPGS